MARQPNQPKDAPAAAPAEDSPAPAQKPGAESAKSKRFVTGAAIGIGSAALVAALLYANRARKTDKNG